MTCAVLADVTEPDVLDNLGISNLDCVIYGVSTNMQASIMATILTKEKGVRFVVAKAENEIHKHILEKVGADKIVFPEAGDGYTAGTESDGRRIRRFGRTVQRIQHG